MKRGLKFLLLAGFALDLSASDVHYRVVPLELVRNDDYNATYGYTINDHGTVAGLVYRDHIRPYPSGSYNGVFISSPEDGFHEIGDYDGFLTQPHRINNRGQFTAIVRLAYYTNGQNVYFEHPVRYTPGVGFERLVDLGSTHARTLGINSRGDVVGVIYMTNWLTRAFFYSNERGIVDLGTFGGADASAIDINDQGWISGNVRFQGEAQMAYLYHEERGLTLLGRGRGLRVNEQQVVLCESDEYDPQLVFPDGRIAKILGRNWLFPKSGIDVNDSNVVVGAASLWGDPSGLTIYSRAFIWTEAEGIRDLNAHIPPDSGWNLSDALSINNRGQITGWASLVGKGVAYRLDPIPPKPRIVLNSTNVVVSWSPAWPGIRLEAAESLTSTNWQTLTTNNTNVVALPRSTPMRFFRLNLEALRGLCCAPESEDDGPDAPYAFATAREPRSAGTLYPIYEIRLLNSLRFIAPDGVHTRVVFEGGGYDPDDDPLTFEWSTKVEDQWCVFARTKWATNMFDRPGRHEIQLRASDAELWGTNRITIEILAPADILTRLLAFVEGRPDQEAGALSFIGLVRGALNEFQQSNYPCGVEMLDQALALMETEAVLADSELNGEVQFMVQTLVEVVGNGASPPP